MTCCLPLYGKNKEKRKMRKEQIKMGDRTVEELVPKRFWKWRKIFGKEESERKPIRKP